MLCLQVLTGSKAVKSGEWSNRKMTSSDSPANHNLGLKTQPPVTRQLCGVWVSVVVSVLALYDFPKMIVSSRHFLKHAVIFFLLLFQKILSPFFYTCACSQSCSLSLASSFVPFSPLPLN